METVNIATLKAKLSHYLRSVKKGVIVNVLERSSPIARIVPYQNDNNVLPSRVPVRPLQSVAVPSVPARDLGSLDALLEERQSNR